MFNRKLNEQAPPQGEGYRTLGGRFLVCDSNLSGLPSPVRARERANRFRTPS